MVHEVISTNWTYASCTHFFRELKLKRYHILIQWNHIQGKLLHGDQVMNFFLLKNLKQQDIIFITLYSRGSKNNENESQRVKEDGNNHTPSHTRQTYEEQSKRSSLSESLSKYHSECEKLCVS